MYTSLLPFHQPLLRHLCRLAFTVGLLAACWLPAAFAQTTLIDPAGAGGFALGNDFASNGWTVANGTINNWYVGTVPTGFATNSAYVSVDNGVTHTYNTSGTSVVHFYRDVTFPAGEGNILLTFQWYGLGEASFDGLQVSIAPTSVTPTANNVANGSTIVAVSPLVPGATVVGNTVYNSAAAVQTTTLTIPASLVGNCSSASTVRLIFSWRNDSSVGALPPTAVNNISLTSAGSTPSPTASPFTINNTLPTSGTNFASFTAAINWLNAASACTPITNPIVFNVSAGQTFNENTPAITQTGTAANPITFQKSGAGANPVITPIGTAAVTDFGICISGGDYFTFDGIDINTSASVLVEFGYAVRNASATNGAANNTIQNMNITMNTVPIAVVSGIVQSANSAAVGGFIPTATSGTNTNNRYYNFTITGSKAAAVYLVGGSSTFFDSGTEIGTTSCAINNTITGMEISSATGLVAPIYALFQSSIKIFNNIIQPFSASTSATIDGIWINHLATSTVSAGLCEVYNNKVLGHTNTNTAAGVSSGIHVILTSNASSISRVYNNWVTGIENSFSGTTGRIAGMRIQSSGTGTGATHNVDFNNVRIAPSNLTITNTCISVGSTASINNVRNNIFANFTAPQTTGKHYIADVPNAVAVGAAGSVWNYNDYYLANANAAATTGTPNGYIGLAGGNDYAALSQWQAAMAITTPGTDANTVQIDPLYLSASDLHIAAPMLNGAASPSPVSWVTNDIDCQTRPLPSGNYDIGADEIEICTGTPTAGTISSSGATCAGQSVTLTLTGASAGGGISYQWRSSTTMGGPLYRHFGRNEYHLHRH